MQVGVQLPEVERIVRWPELRRMAVLAEDVGLDSIWLGDHYLYGEGADARGPWEVWTQLAAIAAVTDRVRLAPFVASLAFHQPPVLAKLASTVDEVAAGRLMLGIGAGWNEREFRALGIPFDRRVDRFEEAFHIVRRLVEGDVVHHEGEFFHLEGMVLHPPSSSGRPIPMMVGSMGRRMLEITLPHVAAWNAWFQDFENLPEQIPALLGRLEAACDAAGRDPATLERSVALLLDFGSTEPRNHSINPITGSTTEMAAALHRAAEAGIDHVQAVLDPITESTIEQLGEVVAELRR